MKKPLLLLTVVAIALVGWLLLRGPVGTEPATLDAERPAAEVTRADKREDVLQRRRTEAADAVDADEQSYAAQFVAPDDARPSSAPEIPLGSYIISGQALDDSGRSIRDVPISLRPASRNQTSKAPLQLQSWSDGQGNFEFSGLPEGDFVLTVLETAAFAAATISARSGSEGVQVLLRRKTREVMVRGQVVDEMGDPLAGTRITQSSVGNTATRSDQQGHYELITNPAGGGLITIRAELAGYRTRVERFPIEENEYGPVELDLLLEELVDQLSVQGQLVDPSGKPVASQRVYLRSAAAGSNYLARSDGNGQFSFNSVIPGSDYTLQVQPGQGYQDHTRRDLELLAEGSVLKIVLEPASFGILGGQFRNASGEPVSGFSWWLRSASASGQPVAVTSDSEGLFLVEQAPAGELTIQTQAAPWLKVTGMRLEPGAETYVDLVVDVGNLELSGYVVTPAGEPLSGLIARLSWRHKDGPLLSTAQRQVRCDDRGRFLFRGLDAGTHTLEIAGAKGFRPLRRQINVDADSDELTFEMRPR